ncbi:MAG: DUF4416 family protein [bacterium]|nr:DUF4416 family protein [bacterium]
MGEIKIPKKIKPFAGLLLADLCLLDEVERRLESVFGPIDLQSEIIPFSHSDYYCPEMGKQILRLWVSFSELSDPGNLACWKIEANGLEMIWAHREEGKARRQVNIDPGYVTDSKVILASTKDYSHRIYLGHGIYAEITLGYRRNKGWQSFDWTYPDYREKAAADFFTLMRNSLLAKRRAE